MARLALSALFPEEAPLPMQTEVPHHLEGKFGTIGGAGNVPLPTKAGYEARAIKKLRKVAKRNLGNLIVRRDKSGKLRQYLADAEGRMVRVPYSQVKQWVDDSKA